MTLSEAKAQSKSVINTLRSLGVPDVEIRHRLVTNMGFAPGFVDNQLNRLLPPVRQAETVKRKNKQLFKPGSLQARIFAMSGEKLFDKAHMKEVKRTLIAEGLDYTAVQSAAYAVRSKIKGIQL